MKDRYRVVNQRQTITNNCTMVFVIIGTNLGKFYGKCKAECSDFRFNSYPTYYIATQRAYLHFLTQAKKDELNKTLTALQMYKSSAKTKSMFNSFYGYYLQWQRATDRYEQVKRDLEQYMMSLDKHH